MHACGEKMEGLLTLNELSIYTPVPQKMYFVEEQPGALQNGLSAVRQSLQPYLQTIKGVFRSVKGGAVNAYHAGEDVYFFLKEPSPGFLPRVALITVSGLTGVILARNGSRMKRFWFPIGLAGAGTAVCYPTQTVVLLKVSGNKLSAATQWSKSVMATVWKSVHTKETYAPSSPSQEAGVPSLKAEPEDPASLVEAEVLSAWDEESPPAEASQTAAAHAPAGAGPAQGSGTERPVPSAEPEFLVVSVAGRTTSRSAPHSAQTLPEGAKAETPTENQHSVVESKLMDFGQSNPEDADLYSTRG